VKVQGEGRPKWRLIEAYLHHRGSVTKSVKLSAASFESTSFSSSARAQTWGCNSAV
jgi:hypothetical protein